MIKIFYNQKKGGTVTALLSLDKQRFWYGIWRSCGRPRQGHVYIHVIKLPRNCRAACKQAMNFNMNNVALQLHSMYRGRDLKKFWNLIHSAKRHKSSHEDITIFSLKSFLRDKFKQSTIKSDVILNAELEVQTKLDNLHNVDFIDKVMFKSMVIRYMKKLNLGSSPDSDGILAEHLKYAIDSKTVE